MFRRERCYNGGNQHKFEPRFEEEPHPAVLRGVEAQGAGLSQLRTLMVYDHYVYDICVWCGKRIFRQTA
jgi:hypothetical protein